MYATAIAAALVPIVCGEVEIDCSRLPDHSAAGLKYRFEVTMQPSAGEQLVQEVRIEIEGATDAALGILEISLQAEGWQYQKVGKKLFVSGPKHPAGARVAWFQVTSTFAAPAMRWLPKPVK